MALQHLEAQDIPVDFFWEIIFLYPDGDTATISQIQAWWIHSRPVNATCQMLAVSGESLHAARRQGALKAQFEWLIFCDPSTLLDKHYLFYAWQALLLQQDTGAATGAWHPVTDHIQFPEWFEEASILFSAAGLVTRKSLLLQLGNSPFLLQHTGADTEYLKRLQLSGYLPIPQPMLKLTYFIPAAILGHEQPPKDITRGMSILSLYEKALLLVQQSKQSNRWQLILQYFRRKLLFSKTKADPVIPIIHASIRRR